MFNNISAISNEKKEREKGRRYGRTAAQYGYKKSIFGENDNRSIIYQNAYNETYDKEACSFNNEKKERRNGRDRGRRHAKFGCKRTIFGENDNCSIIYQNAYNEAYEKYKKYEKAVASSPEEKKRRLAEALRKDNARNGTPKRGFTVAQDTPEHQEKFNSKLFYPQQNLSPSPCFHDFSKPGMEYTIDYSEKPNPPQEPDTVINSVEELSHYLDSLSSPTPDARPLTPLLPQDKATPINFDAAGDLFGVYETIQPTSLNQSRLYQPIFFSTRVPQEQQTRQEASVHVIADRINKKNQI